MSSLKNQLQDAAQRSSGIFAEYELSNGDYLLVKFEYCDQNDGIKVLSDFCLDRRFSGLAIDLNPSDDPNIINGFVIPFDHEYFDNIDHYLQQVGQEVVEGYLIPNNLF